MKNLSIVGLLGLSVLFGCVDDGVGLDGGPIDVGPLDAGPPALEFCEDVGSLRLNAQGEFESVPVRCPRGAVCGSSTGFTACYRDGTFKSLGAQPVIESLERKTAHNPDYPYCTRNDQCDPAPTRGLCFFQPGCAEPTGICCPGNVCGQEPGFQAAEWDCSDGRCLTYCGCDGVTYNHLPTEPYAYPGPCR